MPRDIEFPAMFGRNDEPKTYPVATEEEILEFVNRGREAGGANVLEALLPSVPSDESACLIANALNFGCEVGSLSTGLPFDLEDSDTYRYVWSMALPFHTQREEVDRIAEALDLSIVSYGTKQTSPELGPLPAHIGNAADAFDEGLAFRDFNVNVYDDEDEEDA